MASECRFPIISRCSHGCGEHNWSNAALCDIGVAALRYTLDAIAVWSPISARACPLCTYNEGKFLASCAWHQEVEALRREIGEKWHGYNVELHWGWGSGHRFQETYRFHVNTLDEIDNVVRSFIPKMVDRYAFDCGRVSHPLNPWLYGLTVTPVGKGEDRGTNQYDQIIKAAVKAREKELLEALAAAKEGKGESQVRPCRDDRFDLEKLRNYVYSPIPVSWFRLPNPPSNWENVLFVTYLWHGVTGTDAEMSVSWT